MRSSWKGPFIDFTLFKKKRLLLKDKKKNPYSKSLAFTVRSRRSTILPSFENTSCKIYNGNKYIWLPIKLHHVGQKFGDFVLTKRKCRPKAKALKALKSKKS